MTDMAEYESLLASRFAALATHEAGDWLEVRRRARRMRVRRAALLLAAALATVVVAAPALGLHRVVVDWFEAEPASGRTQLEFLQLGVIAPEGMDPGVIPNSARKVTTVRLSRRAYTLSVAPTRAGGFCWQWSDYVGSCTRDRTESYPSEAGNLNVFALGAGFQADEEGTVSRVSGRLLGENIERLSLEYEGGTTAEVPFVWVSEPIDAGFYLYEVPEQHLKRGDRARALVATDSDGTTVARMKFPVPRPEDIDRPVRLPDGERTQLPTNALVGKARRLIDFRAENGARITTWVIPRADGSRCYVYTRGRTCIPLGQEAHPLGAGMHGGGTVLVAGQVRSDVVIYELRYEDGTVERLEPVESFILHEITASHYSRGHRLERIRALDRDGAVLAQQAVRTNAFGVYPCEKPVDVGHGVMACP